MRGRDVSCSLTLTGPSAGEVRSSIWKPGLTACCGLCLQPLTRRGWGWFCESPECLYEGKQIAPLFRQVGKWTFYREREGVV